MDDDIVLCMRCCIRHNVCFSLTHTNKRMHKPLVAFSHIVKFYKITQKYYWDFTHTYQRGCTPKLLGFRHGYDSVWMRANFVHEWYYISVNERLVCEREFCPKGGGAKTLGLRASHCEFNGKMSEIQRRLNR